MKKKYHISLLCFAAAVLSIIPLFVFKLSAQKNPSEPGYYADFSDEYRIAENYYLFNVNLTADDGAMKVNFIDNTGRGECFDPYFSLPLDKGKVDCEEYGYFAMLLKTDKWDRQLQIRFKTTTNREPNFPTHYVTLEKTDDYQLIVFQLTDPSGLAFSTETHYTGKYSEIRIDCFENECPVNTEYYIRGYGLYASEEDALKFAEFLERGKTEHKEEETEDHSMFWRGSQFDNPEKKMRMRWLSYGFNRESYTGDISKFLMQGYGGIVSNVNFNSEYLRDSEQFRLLADVYTLADRNGMKVWIYDEYQWPSGKAFGLVLEGHDEYQATGIQMFGISGNGNVDFTLPDNYLKIMYAELTDSDGTRVPDFSDRKISSSASGRWTLDIYALRYTYEGVEDRTKFDTLRDVDLLNPDAVKRFIDLTYVKYRDEMGDAFRKVEAFFTDEPLLGNRGKKNYAVWTEKLPEKFREKYGYDLEIKYIFSGDTADARVQRQNYYELVADMFAAAYTEQIAEWCEANGTAGSGHLLFEENMNDHIETYGGGFLKIAGAMTIPGSDSLWTVPDDMLNPNVFIGNYMGLKYVGSAAVNNGKKDVMVEFNPACCDNETFSKDVLYYSYGGAAMMRMFGANIFNVINPVNSYNTEQINALNKYVGRMNTVLDGSINSTELAVYYPIETVQAYHNANTVHSAENGSGQSESEKINLKYENMCLALLQAKADFNIIDAESVLRSEITSDGYLAIGNGIYKTVVLGYAEYISPDVLEKLAGFAERGGKVIFVGNIPAYSTVRGDDAEIASVMEKFENAPRYSSFSPDTAEKISEETAHILKTGGIADKQHKNLWISDFTTEDKDIVFALNLMKRETEFSAEFSDGYPGVYYTYFPASGKIEEYEGTQKITLPSYECCFIVRDSDNSRRHTHSENSTSVKSGSPALKIGLTAAAAAAACSSAIVFGKKKNNKNK